VSLLCALTSLTNIAGFIKPLQSFLNAHPKAASVITSLAPVILVALLTIAICPILLVIANKADTIYTRLGIHNSVLERFWKFCTCPLSTREPILILYCSNGQRSSLLRCKLMGARELRLMMTPQVGQTAIEAYLTSFQTKGFDPLSTVASAFVSKRQQVDTKPDQYA